MNLLILLSGIQITLLLIILILVSFRRMPRVKYEEKVRRLYRIVMGREMEEE